MPFTTIKLFVKRDYPVAGLFDGIYKVRGILENQEAVVIMEDGKYAGLLTACDIFNKPYQVIADCISEKPKLPANTGTYEAYEIFAQANTMALPVFELEEFLGILYKDELLGHFILESQQLMFSNKNLVMENQTLLGSKEKMENLVYSISHDLKSPINNIRSLNEMLLERAKDFSEETLELVKYTEIACNKATAVISELLNFNQPVIIPTGEDKLIEVNSLLSRFMPMYEANAEKKELELEVLLAKEDLHLKMKPVDFTRIIDNLVSNAIKFTGIKGKVSIKTLKEDGKVSIKVSDTGIGIPPEIKKDMFKKFSLAGRLGTCGEQSTGLGLSIVKQIVEQNNGEIHLESEKSKGTCFTITFQEAKPETVHC